MVSTGVVVGETAVGVGQGSRGSRTERWSVTTVVHFGAEDLTTRNKAELKSDDGDHLEMNTRH